MGYNTFPLIRFQTMMRSIAESAQSPNSAKAFVVSP